jgi:ubiquinone/menaquinone biosynthesis C-methylase UbiE
MSSTPGNAREDRSEDGFYAYYEQASLTDATMQRVAANKDMLMRVRRSLGLGDAALDIADIGCGAGTQAMHWARDGHRVRGFDLNDGLIELAIERATNAGIDDARFGVASAENLPLDDACVDICLMPELLEHVPDWQTCMNECVRVLRPGGLLYISTTNVLCPVQQEYELPLYSWYPAPLKRHYERVAVTTRPELVSHAQYPAIHWFSFYRLRDELADRGFDMAFDRFDCLDVDAHGAPVRAAVGLVRALPPLRWLGQVLTPYTSIVARKAPASA